MTAVRLAQKMSDNYNEQIKVESKKGDEVS